MPEHVLVNVAIGGFFGFGENREAYVAEGVYPGVNALNVGLVNVGEKCSFTDDVLGVAVFFGGYCGALLEEP